jgi:hypothetical protein
MPLIYIHTRIHMHLHTRIHMHLYKYQMEDEEIENCE